jgi:hypothetical protein
MAIDTMKRAAEAIATAMSAACAVGAIAAEQGKVVQGEALREMFAEHEFADGVHFAYQFRAGGTFSGTEMAKDVRGTWRLSGQEICWTWTRPRCGHQPVSKRIRAVVRHFEADRVEEMNRGLL